MVGVDRMEVVDQLIVSQDGGASKEMAGELWREAVLSLSRLTVGVENLLYLLNN